MTVFLTILLVLALIFVAYYAFKRMDLGEVAADEYNVAGVIWNVFWIYIAACAASNLTDAIGLINK